MASVERTAFMTKPHPYRCKACGRREHVNAANRKEAAGIARSRRWLCARCRSRAQAPYVREYGVRIGVGLHRAGF